MEPTAPHPVQLPQSTSQEVSLLLIQADEQRAQLEQELAELERLNQDLFEQKAQLNSWDPPESKSRLWELEEQILPAQEALERRAEMIVSLCRRALELEPNEGFEAQAKLSDLCWRMLSRAEEQGDASSAQQYLALLTLHDDGRYTDLIEGTATLQVATDPDGARVALRRLEVRGRRLVPGEATDLGPSPVEPMDLAPGRYLLEVQLEGYAPIRRPLLVGRGEDLEVQLRCSASRVVGPDFVVIPASRFSLGGDLEASGALPPRSPFRDNFAMGRFPVTVGEYLLFIDDLASTDPGQALRYSPGPAEGRRDPRQPVVGVSYDAAEAYCTWISARTGIEHRLPSEEEWEKAARGVDGRSFPWGDAFDPSFCHMRASQPGQPDRLPVGSFAADVSIYGVRDLAGGVSEWTTSSYADVAVAPLQVVRGGSFDAGAESCRSAQRSGIPRNAHSSVGIRLVRPLPPGGGERVTPAIVPQLMNDELVSARLPRPMQQERLTISAALERVRSMSSQLAASDTPRQLLPLLLGETVQLVGAERALLLRRHNDAEELQILEARTAAAEPLPTSDQGYDAQVALAALKQNRVIALDFDEMPVLAVPLPDGQTCLLLERRFQHGRLGDDAELIAQAAADSLALALRLAESS
jgi:formylglycine-generating enzyme required for sulfatase activity